MIISEADWLIVVYSNSSLFVVKYAIGRLVAEWKMRLVLSNSSWVQFHKQYFSFTLSVLSESPWWEITIMNLKQLEIVFYIITRELPTTLPPFWLSSSIYFPLKTSPYLVSITLVYCNIQITYFFEYVFEWFLLWHLFNPLNTYGILKSVLSYR